MPKKYKVTGFARFVIVMLFIAPVAFLAASYFNGEDGMQNLKEMLGWSDEQPTEQVQEAPTPDTATKTEILTTPEESESPQASENDTVAEQASASMEAIQALEEELETTREELEEMKSENYDLLKTLEEKNAEIIRLKEQLANISPSAEGGDQ